MDSNDTACNEYVLCRDCEHGRGSFISADAEFTCPRWGGDFKMKNVGICKYFKEFHDADSRD